MTKKENGYAVEHMAATLNADIAMMLIRDNFIVSCLRHDWKKKIL